METTKRIIIVLILALITTDQAISAEPESSNTTSASCLLKITSNPAILPLNDTTIEYLLRSSGVCGKAAREVLDIQFTDEILEVEWLADETDMTTPPIGDNTTRNEAGRVDLYNEEFETTMGNMGAYRNPRPNTPPRRSPESFNTSSEQMILLRIAVYLDRSDRAAKPAAQEFMNALIDNLRETFNRAFDEHRGRLNNRLKLADDETARAENEVRIIQERLNDISGSTILDRDRILDEINDLRRELQAMEMNQTTDRITVDTITNQIAETQIKSKEQLTNDDVVRELERLLENQTQLSASMNKQLEAGRAPGDRLADIEEKITRTRIELAQRREQLRRSAGGERIESLNSQLADRSIQSAQNQARIRWIAEQLRESEELLSKADDYELFSLKADIAKGNLREVIIWRDRLSRQIRMLQAPVVSVLGAD